MKKIIVIDDDRDVRDVLVFALENEGYRVLSYENGKEGLKAIEVMEILPGLIIVDYLMPEMDGISFINHLRTHHPETFSKVAIAISSAMGPMAPELKSLPGVFHLHKPMNLDDLLKLASEHCLS